MTRHSDYRRQALQCAVAVIACLCLVAASAEAGGADGPLPPAELPGFGAVRPVAQLDPAASPPAGTLVLEAPGGKVAYRFPPLPGSGEFAFYSMAEADFADIDGDGLEDVVAVIEYVTGIGPSGASPFPIAAVYLRRGDTFEADEARQAVVNNPPASERWSNLAALIPLLKEIR